MEVARLVNDEESPMGRILDIHAPHMVNSCQGKVAGLLCIN